MKTYVGNRSGGICEVWIEENGNRRDLPLYLHVRNHSPSGFEWGYGGSGPAQLALALLVEHFTVDRGDGMPWSNIEAALHLYQRFKFKVVGGLDKKAWRLTTTDINRAIEELRQEETASKN